MLGLPAQKGADGKIHIRWILPDPPPDLMAELRAVAVVLNEASQLKNRTTAEKFQQFAESLLSSRAKELTDIMENVGQVARLVTTERCSGSRVADLSFENSPRTR